MSDELIDFARELAQHGEDLERQDAQFRRDFQALPLHLQLHLLHLMIRRVFGPTEDGGAVRPAHDGA